MSGKKELRLIEKLMNEKGYPVYCETLEENLAKEYFSTDLPEVLIHMFFEEGKDREIFETLRKSKDEILKLFEGRSFFVKPHTVHYFITSKLLSAVCPDYKSYYFSPMTGVKRVVDRGDKKVLEIELKLLLIKKGNVSDPQAVYNLLLEIITGFNEISNYVKILKVSVASQDSPFAVEGEPTPQFEEIFSET